MRNSEQYEIREKNRLGVASRFLKIVALENNLDVSELVNKLTRWYFKLNHKKLGFILYGRTNSGRSLLADLLTSMYNVWDIGVFSCPPGTSINQFYLDGLLNTFI